MRIAGHFKPSSVDLGLRVVATEVAGHPVDPVNLEEEFFDLQDQIIHNSNYSVSSIIRQYDLALGGKVPSLDASFTKLDETPIEVSPEGQLRSSIPGDVRVKIEGKIEGGKVALYHTQSLREETTQAVLTNTSIGYIEGSLAGELYDSVISRIEGKDPLVALPLFSTQNHASGIYVRNTGCWAHDFRDALACISPWNSHMGVRGGGVLIAPDVILFAAHYPLNVGATVRFVTAADEVVERTIISRKRHPDYVGRYLYFPDLMIGRLDSPISSIRPAKILPEDREDYLPAKLLNEAKAPWGHARRFPVIKIDQEKKALLAERGAFGPKGGPHGPYNPALIPWAEPSIGGDSGGPVGIVIGDDFVFLSVVTFAFTGSGTSLEPFKADINQMMADLGSPYTLTEADFSGFNFYGEYHPDAEDYFARLTGAGDTEHEPYKTAIDLLFRDLDDAGMLDKFGACQLWMGTGYPGRDVPLKTGYAVPTLYNVTSAAYDVATGLKGDGTALYVNTRMANDALPQDDFSMGVWITEHHSIVSTAHYMGGVSDTFLGRSSNNIPGSAYTRCRNTANNFRSTLPSHQGLYGMSRQSDGGYHMRILGTNDFYPRVSTAPGAGNLQVFRATASVYCNGRIAFYWAGRAVELETIDTILTAYAARVAAIAV